MNQNSPSLRAQLQALKQEHPFGRDWQQESLFRAVIDILLEETADYDDDDIRNFFHDLAEHGCVSGMVSSLIYYRDTHEFFDAHYDAIESVRQGMEDALGMPLTIHGDLKNRLAWSAFEEMSSRVRELLKCM